MEATLSLAVMLACVFTVVGSTIEREYAQEWAVHVPEGEQAARELAEDNGLEFIRQIGTLKNYYRLHRKEASPDAISKREFLDVTFALLADKRVTWAKQQELKEHMRRRGIPDIVAPDATGDDMTLKFNDPLYPQQWYLYNDGQNGATPGMDMNLMPAWKLGYTGKGVHVTIVDDGLDGTHPDLAPNFDIDSSYDFNNKSGNDQDPHPDDRPAKGSENAHGTRCAGEVAAVANNNLCGVGVAYEASIGGLRILDGPVTDALEAEALLYNNQHIDIYSCCWGPPDRGKDFTLPHELTTAALIAGVKEGREGKGSLFVWASGNGGASNDDCNADGYVSRPETISVGSINDEGLIPYFVEECSSTLAVALSGGPSDSPFSTSNERSASYGLNLVSTTDLHGKCTTSFVGTSSAAPLASGVLAIVLQANPKLTWRDVQHIITQGAYIPTPMESGWHINGAGFHLNHKVGFGVLDVGKMVELALTWKNVGPRITCEIERQEQELVVGQGHAKRVTMKVSSCPYITKLEHTVAHISFQAPRRGDVSITLYSPYGTPSQLISTRKYDDSDEGLEDYPFMTVHNWGEEANGEWTLELRYNESPKDLKEPPPLLPRDKYQFATLTMWGFTMFGTGDEPGSEEEEEAYDENTRVHDEAAGKGDPKTILKVYNEEQTADEEIHVDIADLADGVKEPPNLAHNLNNDGEVETGDFDGVLDKRMQILELLEKEEKLGKLEMLLRALDTDMLDALLRELAEGVSEMQETEKKSNNQERSVDPKGSSARRSQNTESQNTEMFKLKRMLELRDLIQDYRR